MYTIHYTSDIIRGRNNFGVDEIHENMSKNSIISFVNELDTAYGKHKIISGMELWQNKNDVHTVSIFKKGKLVKYSEIVNEQWRSSKHCNYCIFSLLSFYDFLSCCDFSNIFCRILFWAVVLFFIRCI